MRKNIRRTLDPLFQQPACPRAWYGRLWGRASQFIDRTREHDGAIPRCGAVSRIREGDLRAKYGDCVRRCNGCRNDRGENSWIQAERRVRFQRRTLRRLDRRREALHAPAKPEPWMGIRNALQYGRVCPTHDSAHFDTDGKNLANADEDAFVLHRGSAAAVPGEDCLRLNLWTPEINATHKRPVMVYMHGGGFSGGSGHDLLSYDGESLARNHDVVVVTHNHRLNVYGYLNLAGIGGEEFASSANVGMLDIVAVLEWVRDNIATFGGDPGNVTIFGQSGGGGKVIALMAMPAAKGLFHRAIVQSGPFLKSLSPDYSGRVAELLMEELGLSKSQVNELQKIPVDRLSGAAVEAMKKMPRPRPSLRETFGERDWGPTVDGRVLPHHPFDPGAPTVSANVPLLTGTNLHEFVNGLDRPDANAMGVEELNRLVREEFGDDSEAIIAAYRLDYPKATPFNLYATIAASRLRVPAFAQATRKAALGAAPAYAYVYCLADTRFGQSPRSIPCL